MNSKRSSGRGKAAKNQSTSHAIDPADESAAGDGALSPKPSVLNDPKTIRILQIAVVTMGVILVVGLFTVIARIAYLYLGSGSQGFAISNVATNGETIPLALPPGARISTMSLSGNRLAVHFKAPSGSGIRILNTQTGTVETKINLIPAVPAN